MTTSPATLRRLSGAELQALPTEAFEAYEAELEDAYWATSKASFLRFCESVEVPGVVSGADDDGSYFPSRVQPAAHHKLIIDTVQKLADGRLDDVDGVMVFMPPGSAKSTYTSVLAPAWLLGRTPGTNVIATSYGDDLAQRFGRRVRHIVRSPEFFKIMGTTIRSDNQDVKDWSLENASEYRASGLGGTITGIRADYLFIDDPVKNREEADSELIREKRWEAYSDDVQSRLKPGGKIFIIMCMTGDTPVLMENGSLKLLCDIRPGDRVATYNNGRIAVSTVRNWANQGPDRVYEIRMKSGISVRANARHPFLAEIDGRTTWQRTDTLRKGSIILRVIGESGAALNVQRTTATGQQNAEDCACPTTTNCDGNAGIDRHLSTLNHAARHVCATAMEFLQKNMISALPSRAVSVPSVSSHLGRPRAVIGATNSASITAITQEKSGASCVMTAISPLDTEKPQTCCAPLLDTYSVVKDEVLSVTDAGIEDVFDVEIEGTENFIANGLVSHNTRWHEDDLCGRLLGEKWKGQSGLWRTTDGRLFLVINCPLIAEHKDDPLKRSPGDLLWPQWFRQKDADRLRESAKKGGTLARTWSSLYQQRPAPNEGAILARAYWRKWEKPQLPECEQIYLCYDTAFEEGEENDFSAMTAWGVFQTTSRKETGEEYNHRHVILLGAWMEKVSAVDLMSIAVKGYTDADTGKRVMSHCQLFRPDRVLIEKRASGIQLIQEMQRARIPVKPWLPKGKPGAKGKVPRAHAIAVILEQGSVWYVPGVKTDMVLDQCAAFPFGTHDDAVDTVTMALAYFRDRFIFQTADDELDEGELRERLIERSADRRPRNLYAGPATRSRNNDLDERDIDSMTPETRRRLYDG